jgi:RNA polymerase sigma-70 factor (ECF subfamily)
MVKMKTGNVNKATFSKLIEENQGIIHKITRVYADGAEDREDLFQEICLQLWRSYGNFREEAKFSTWMYRVALNTAISNIRKNKSRFHYEPLEKHAQIPSETEEQNEEVQLIYSAIARLNRIDKAIILLWLEDKDYDEIASVMGITKTNVSVKLVRIKRKLEDWINETEKQSHER